MGKQKGGPYQLCSGLGVCVYVCVCVCVCVWVWVWCYVNLNFLLDKGPTGKGPSLQLKRGPGRYIAKCWKGKN
jgi:hypothetical protein